MSTTRIHAALCEGLIVSHGPYDDDGRRRVTFQYTGVDGAPYVVKAMQRKQGSKTRLMCPACGQWAAALVPTARGLRCAVCKGSN